MPKLIIKRNSEWAISNRAIEIYLNGDKLGEVGDKEIKEFSLRQGTYTLQAKLDWCGSRQLEFLVDKDEEKMVELTGFVFSKYLLPLAFFTVLVYLFFLIIFNTNSLVLGTLMMFYMGYILYYTSFGKDQYLQIKEMN